MAAIDKVIPIRMCIEEEILGADIWIHNIRHDYYDFNSIIAEMRREGLDLCPHIRVEDRTKTSLDFNLFIIDKFLTKHKRNHWIKKLFDKNQIENYKKDIDSKNRSDLNESRIQVKAAWVSSKPRIFSLTNTKKY